MNKFILLFGVLVCLLAVSARHFERTEEAEDQDTLKRKEHVSGHRRKRWQSSYGYDYPPPSYYYERRDDRYSQDIQNIYRLLEDISHYIRRTPPPPSPPQPIYIPYPIITGAFCNTPKNTTVPKLPETPPRNAFTDTMDQNRNWGLLAPEEDDFPEDENDGARPISFEPLVPKQLMKRPAPPVEHGSQQTVPIFNSPPVPSIQSKIQASASESASSGTVIPGMCNAAILTCCGFSGDTNKQRQCFGNMGCSVRYDSNTCTPGSIQIALDSFRLAYAPKN